MKMPMLGVPEDKGSEPGGSDLDDAAQDMLDAIKDDDAKALALALRRAHEICAGYEDDSDEE